MQAFKKNIFLFIVTFLVLSLLIHIDKWFTVPLEHLSLLSKHPMPYHPLLYSFLIFLLIYLFIAIVKLIMKLFKKITGK